MLLTKPQKKILALVEKLGAVRYGQLVTLLGGSGSPSAEKLDAMLRQLRYAGLLRGNGEIVCASGVDPPRNAYLEAIDIMLEVTGGDVLDCAAGRAPILLRFLSGGEQSRPFFVVSGQTPALDLPLPLLPGQRAIVLLPENDPALRAALPSSHFAAVPGLHGQHHFFRCGGK